jgi:hypothetical protein
MLSGQHRKRHKRFSRAELDQKIGSSVFLECSVSELAILHSQRFRATETFELLTIQK